MTTLAHISDVHLAPLPPVRPQDLLSKRITGFLNWKLKRNKTLDGDGLGNLIRHMRSHEPDLVAITGDLTNLALEAEIERAGEWLAGVGSSDEVCVCPGNHDAYVRGALETALGRWHGYMEGETVNEAPFPYVRRVGDVAVIACSSAITTPPFFAAGKFDDEQAARLARCLDVLGEAGYFRVVMIHHPPTVEDRNFRLGLWGGQLFRDVVAEHGAELILHGHTHKSTIHSIPGRTMDVPVIGVAAAGAAQGGRHDDPARYNLFRIERSGNGWSCLMREFGFQRLGSEIVMRLQMRIY